MKLSNYLNSKCIYLNLEGSTKEEIITKILNKNSENDKKFHNSVCSIKRAVFTRENEISTALGRGIAIPHAKVEDYDDVLLSIGVVKEPIECFMANNREKDRVKIFFVIVAQTLKSKIILKIMSSLSKLSIFNPELLEKIKNSNNKNEIYDLLSDLDVKIEHKIRAEDIMNSDLTPATINDTLDHIAMRLITEGKPGFPVVDKDGYFLGEITEKELISYGMPNYTTLMSDLNFFTVGEPFEEYLKNETKVIIKDIYRKNSLYIDRKTPIMEICNLIVHKNHTRIYVVENGIYYGTILRVDIIKKVLHI